MVWIAGSFGIREKGVGQTFYYLSVQLILLLLLKIPTQYSQQVTQCHYLCLDFIIVWSQANN